MQNMYIRLTRAALSDFKIKIQQPSLELNARQL